MRVSKSLIVPAMGAVAFVEPRRDRRIPIEDDVQRLVNGHSDRNQTERDKGRYRGLSPEPVEKPVGRLGRLEGVPPVLDLFTGLERRRSRASER